MDGCFYCVPITVEILANPYIERPTGDDNDRYADDDDGGV
jgi:hypothetical protein